MNGKHSAALRTLASAADGRVIPLGELYGTRYAKGAAGDGFAVLPPAAAYRLRLSAGNAARGIFGGNAGGMRLRNTLGALRSRRTPRTWLYSPADGVVTALDPCGRLTLCTGDAVELCVEFGAGAELSAVQGGRLSAGERFGSVASDALVEGCAAIVVFPDMERVTELHIEAGNRRGGRRTAWYGVYL